MFALKQSLRCLMGGALALATFTAQASPPERLGWVIVNADLPNAEPVYLGPGAGVYDYYSWGDVAPDEAGWNNNATPNLCDVLASYGRPKDCDRALASGLLQPPEMPPMPMFGVYDGRFVGPNASQLLHSIYQLVNQDITGCYSSPATNPNDCEQGYLAAYRERCSQVPTRDQLDFMNEYPNINPQEICYAGLELINTRLTNARIDRSIAEWFGFKFGIKVGPFGVDLNTNLFTNIILMNPYNKALIYARRHDACSKWYNAFDGGNCASWYPGA